MTAQIHQFPPVKKTSDVSPPPDYVVQITFDNLEELPRPEQDRRIPRKSLLVLLAFLAGFALAWLLR